MDSPPQELLEKQIAAWLDAHDYFRYVPAQRKDAELLATHLSTNWQAQESEPPRLILRYVCIHQWSADCLNGLAVNEVEEFWDEAAQQWRQSDDVHEDIGCSNCGGPMRQEAVPEVIEAQEEAHA